MLPAATVYAVIFTLSNIYLAMYLHSSVEAYKSNKELPPWAVKARALLDHLDDTVKPDDLEEISAGIVENGGGGGWMSIFGGEGYAQMDFLQIKADAYNKYDVRDDYELKRAQDKAREESQPAPPTNPESSANDPTTIIEDLFKISLDSKEIFNDGTEYSAETADADSTSYDAEPKNPHKMGQTMDEFIDVVTPMKETDEEGTATNI